MRRRSAFRPDGRSLLLLAAGGLALFLAGLYLGTRLGSGSRQGAEIAADLPAGAPRDPVPAVRPHPPLREDPRPEPLPADGARVALVIDDLGRSVEEVEALAALGIPLAYSVLPFEARTPAVVQAVRAHGGELLCHLPMEGRNGADPGPGALTRGMSPRALRRATERALAAVPGATGANNHMGSLLSADTAAMSAILGAVRERRLFYLDSRTSGDSVGYRVAVELGIPAAERHVFLDADPRAEAVREQFQRLLALARERGAAVAIGHPRPETLAVLADQAPRARALGYEFVPVSYLVDRTDVSPQ